MWSEINYKPVFNFSYIIFYLPSIAFFFTLADGMHEKDDERLI